MEVWLQYLENRSNMTNEELNKIISEQKELSNLPNVELVKQMDLITEEHETIRQSIIQSTTYLDKLEELYNNILKVYQIRNNGK